MNRQNQEASPQAEFLCCIRTLTLLRFLKVKHRRVCLHDNYSNAV